MQKVVFFFLLLIIHPFISEAQNEIEIFSSNNQLVNTFNWAKEKAKSFVQTGKTGPINISERKTASSDSAKYIPSYWAGYPLRTAFYSRDFCHQLAGAHLMGLQNENYQMLKAFAASAKQQQKWYPLWAINFDASPYELDFRNHDNFVREVPAVFELVEKTWQLYKWTGDERYLFNDTIWNFCKKAVTEFIELHDLQFKNGVAEGTGKGIFKGAATYNEQHDVPLIEAGDGIAAQYKAFLSFSEMAREKNEIILAEEFAEKAKNLKKYFNTDWGIKNTDTFNRGITVQNQPVGGWGKENSWFIPMKGISDATTERHFKYLDFINERLESKADIPENIAAISYIPEVFFNNFQDERGWEWMNYIISKLESQHAQSVLTGTNGNYPEVSFVLLSNTIENLLGIEPFAHENKVITFSHLPNEIKRLGAKNIQIGSSLIEIEHNSKHISRIYYQKGQKDLSWQARFPGQPRNFYCDGKNIK